MHVHAMRAHYNAVLYLALLSVRPACFFHIPVLIVCGVESTFSFDFIETRHDMLLLSKFYISMYRSFFTQPMYSLQKNRCHTF